MAYKTFNMDRVYTNNTKFFEQCSKLMFGIVRSEDIYDCVVEVLPGVKGQVADSLAKNYRQLEAPAEKKVIDINFCLYSLLGYYVRATVLLNSTYQSLFLGVCGGDEQISLEQFVMLCQNLEGAQTRYVYLREFVAVARQFQPGLDAAKSSSVLVPYEPFIEFCNKYELFTLKK